MIEFYWMLVSVKAEMSPDEQAHLEMIDVESVAAERLLLDRYRLLTEKLIDF